jgi:hypothetical protein
MRAVRIALGVAVACVAALGLAACHVTSPSDLTNDTWTGVVAPGGASTQFNFNTGKTGEFILKINSITPDAGAAFTVIYGQPGTSNGVAGCNVSGSAIGGTTVDVFDFSLPSGPWCLQMTDPTVALPRSETFSATVSHL